MSELLDLAKIKKYMRELKDQFQNLYWTINKRALTDADKIRGITVTTDDPTDGQALIFDAVLNRYKPGGAGSQVLTGDLRIGSGLVVGNAGANDPGPGEIWLQEQSALPSATGSVIKLINKGNEVFYMDENGVYTQIGSADGWQKENLVWTYAGQFSFTVPGDVRARYRKGTFLTWLQTTPRYGVVASSSYSSPNTTVNVIPNTDYDVANAAITAHFYSYAANPVGWPGWFNWTPTFTGFSVNPTGVHRFSVQGNTCILNVYENQGTSNAATFTFTLPVTAAAACAFLGSAIDNGGLSINPGYGQVANGSNVMNVYKTTGLGGWTASGGKSILAGPIIVPF